MIDSTSQSCQRDRRTPESGQRKSGPRRKIPMPSKKKSHGGDDERNHNPKMPPQAIDAPNRLPAPSSRQRSNGSCEACEACRCELHACDAGVALSPPVQDQRLDTRNGALHSDQRHRVYRAIWCQRIAGQQRPARTADRPNRFVRARCNNPGRPSSSSFAAPPPPRLPGGGWPLAGAKRMARANQRPPGGCAISNRRRPRRCAWVANGALLRQP